VTDRSPTVSAIATTAVTPSEAFKVPTRGRASGEVWIHRTPAGVELGGDVPSGTRQSAISALAGAFRLTWRLRQTLWVLVLKDFKSRYRAQALGLLWSFANPLVMMGTLTFVFTQVLKVQTPHFPIFYLIGAILWQFFNNATLAGTGAMLENASLVKRTTFPRFLLPISAVLSNLVNLAFESFILVAFYFVMPDAYHVSWSLVVLPLLVGIEVIMLFGVVLITAGLNVRYRDVYYLVTSALTVGFWFCPILYSVEMVPTWLRPVMNLNPLSGVIVGTRDIIMKGAWPDPVTLAPGAAAAIVLFLVGCLVFRGQNLRIADHV
jgi:ABC-type polysaccharide/polyol phosphate export permease